MKLIESMLFESCLSQEEKDAIGQQQQINTSLQFFYHQKNSPPQHITGTLREILFRVQALTSPQYYLHFEKIVRACVDDEISFLLQDAKIQEESPTSLSSLVAAKKKNFITEAHFTRFRLKPSSLISTLEKLSTLSFLSWNRKKILLDTISTPLLLEAIIEKDREHKKAYGELFMRREKGKSQETLSFPEEKAFFIMARPHLVMNGTLLQRIHEEISWKALSFFSNKSSKISRSLQEVEEWIEEIDNDEECAKVFIIHTSQDQIGEEIQEIREHPTPLLQLHDTRGMISSLCMEYISQEGNSKLIPFLPDFSENLQEKFRDIHSEKSFEQDLLSMGFERTTFDDGRKITFRYFCPSEKLDEALELLLGIGWKILDIDHKPIFLAEELSFHFNGSTLTKTKRAGEEKNSSQPWNDALFFRNVKKGEAHKLSTVSMGSYSLFLPLKTREFFTLLTNDIVLLPCGAVSFPKEKRGLLFQGDSPSPFISIAMTDEEKYSIKEEKEALAFTGTLRPYQQQGVDWIEKRWKSHESSILADEMGLGKTVQVLSWISEVSKYRGVPASPILIVAPKSLLWNWKQEATRFLPDISIDLYQGQGREKLLLTDPKENKKGGGVPSLLITSFHTLRSDISYFQKNSFLAVIVDEAQMVKNPESMGFQAIASLDRTFTLLLTGTPFENSMKDIWSLFSLLSHDLLGTRETFLKPFTNNLGPNAAAIALRRVKKLIQPFILRRTKNLVASDLPELIEETVLVNMEQEEEERYFLFLHLLQQGKISYERTNSSSPKKQRMEILAAITRLRQMVCHHQLFSFQEEALKALSPPAKWDLFFQDLQTLILEGKKVLIFSHFSTIIDRIIERAHDELKVKGVSYHGKMSDTTIQQVVDSFQTDPSISFFATTMKSGGAGLNITQADAVLIYDPWWNRAVEDQAIARAHRIGRVESVIVKRYITHNSIEERVHEIGLRKKELFSALFSTSDDEAELFATESYDEILLELYQGEIDRRRS